MAPKEIRSQPWRHLLPDLITFRQPHVRIPCRTPSQRLSNRSRRGRIEIAADLGRRILETDPKCGAACHLLGIAAYHKGQMDRAREFFQQALDRAPDEARYHFKYGAGVAPGWVGLRTPAEAYERALGLGLGSVEVYNNLGFVRGRLNRLEAAAAALGKAIGLDPTLSAPHHNLADIRRRQWRLDAALSLYRRAVDLAPQNPKAHTNLLFALNYSPRHTKAAIAAEHPALVWPARPGAAPAERLLPGVGPQPPPPASDSGMSLVI